MTDTLDVIENASGERFTEVFIHDDGACELPRLLPGSDTLAVLRYDSDGTPQGERLLCPEVRLRGRYAPYTADAALLSIEGGRHLAVWSGVHPDGREQVYISAFDEDWRQIGSHHPAADTGGGNQVLPAIAIHDDTLAVAWFDSRNGAWDVYYKRIPLEMFVPRQPPVQVVLFTHIEDNLPASDLSAPEALAEYRGARGRILAFARRTADLGIAWSLQPDWKFLLAAIRFEPGLISPETDGKPLLTYLRDHFGVAIDPHSHEKQGYNYTDVAHLLDSLGVGGSTVVGGHIWDPTLPQFQNWDRFRAAQPGNRFPWASWRGDILMGSGTPNHVNDPVVSGVWRPADRWHFFDHDLNGNIRCVGQYAGDLAGLAELIGFRRSGAISPDSILTASIHVPMSSLLSPAAMQAIEDTLLKPLAGMRNRGDVTLTDFSTLVESWERDDAAAPSVYRPGISTAAEQPAPRPERDIAIRGLAPHPVNAHATVRFSLRSPALVRAEIFDTMGRRVAVADGAFREAGDHVLQLFLHDVSPGFYILRMHTEASSASRAFIVR